MYAPPTQRSATSKEMAYRYSIHIQEELGAHGYMSPFLSFLMRLTMLINSYSPA